MKPWIVTFEGNEWHQESLDGADGVDIARMCEDPWEAIKNPTSSPLALVSVIAVLVANRLGEPLEMALGRVQALKLPALLECVRFVDVEQASADEPAESFS